MRYRIIRGALLGIVLGLLVGVSLSGAMYMFNYMEQGAKFNKQQGLVVEGASENMESQEEQLPQIVIDRERLEESFDRDSYRAVLAEGGITGVARNVVATGGSLKQSEQKQQVTAKEETSVTEEVVPTGGQVYKGALEEQPEDVTSVQDEEKLHEGDTLGDNLLRFHVRAHSNSQLDIELKYKVRDKVLEGIEESMSQCESKEEATDYIIDNLDYIEELSLEAIREAGYGYPVEAYLTKDYFPIRQYGDMVLPAGYYDALRIDIGMAEGENFWCLLYPTMCIPREAGAIITEDGKEELKEELNDEQYEKLFVERQVPADKIEIRFKFLEWLFE